ncbi:MAG: hypothetical protein AABX08_01750 [Nanoarchaeota archaeon]
MATNTSQPKIPEEIKKNFDELKNKLNKIKSSILKEFDKYVMGISLLPPKNIERERERIKIEENRDLTKEEENAIKNEIGILVLVNDSDSRDVNRFTLKDRLIAAIDKITKDIDERIFPTVLLKSELVESCYDGKYDILNLISLSAIIHDPSDILAAIKISEVHKSMVIKKFDKYIVSYVAAGSLFRGEKSNDIDVYIVIDDTDVKKMSRFELKDKLRAIIISMGMQSKEITGVQKEFHIQVYILTDFWESVKDASPVIFTFLRDGVPLYDRGVFMPWKLLLKMGRIRPSPEAIDMHMDVGEKSIELARNRLLNVVSQDIYYGILNPAQAALMLYGIAPPTPVEAIRLLDEIFVKKEKLLEKKYVDILDRIRKFYKDIEHGKVKQLSGSEVDKMLKDADLYMKRIKKLFKQIEKKSEAKTMDEIYDNCMAVAKDILKLEGVKSNPERGFKELANKNIIPERFYGILKAVVKAKQDYGKKTITKQEIEKIRRTSSVFMGAMLDYVQRKRGLELERAKLKFKYGDAFGELYLLDDKVFIINDIDAKEKEVAKAKIVDGKLTNIQKSSLVELEEAIAQKRIPKHVFIQESIFEDLKKLYGKDIKISVNY